MVTTISTNHYNPAAALTAVAESHHNLDSNSLHLAAHYTHHTHHIADPGPGFGVAHWYNYNHTVVVVAVGWYYM